VLLLGWRLREGGAGALITVARFSHDSYIFSHDCHRHAPPRIVPFP